MGAFGPTSRTEHPRELGWRPSRRTIRIADERLSLTVVIVILKNRNDMYGRGRYMIDGVVVMRHASGRNRGMALRKGDRRWGLVLCETVGGERMDRSWVDVAEDPVAKVCDAALRWEHGRALVSAESAFAQRAQAVQFPWTLRWRWGSAQTDSLGGHDEAGGDGGGHCSIDCVA